MDAVGSRRDLIDILSSTRRLVAQPGNDFAPTWWDGPDHALGEMDEAVGQLGNGATLESFGNRLFVLFAATSNLCELSIASGWSDDYLKLAAEFDQAWERFVSEQVRTDLRAHWNELRK